MSLSVNGFWEQGGYNAEVTVFRGEKLSFKGFRVASPSEKSQARNRPLQRHQLDSSQFYIK